MAAVDDTDSEASELLIQVGTETGTLGPVSESFLDTDAARFTRANSAVPTLTDCSRRSDDDETEDYGENEGTLRMTVSTLNRPGSEVPESTDFLWTFGHWSIRVFCSVFNPTFCDFFASVYADKDDSHSELYTYLKTKMHICMHEKLILFDRLVMQSTFDVHIGLWCSYFLFWPNFIPLVF